MNKSEPTIKGFVIRRRCEYCGTRISISTEEGEKCVFKCANCGKEYEFYIRRA